MTRGAQKSRPGDKPSGTANYVGFTTGSMGPVQGDRTYAVITQLLCRLQCAAERRPAHWYRRRALTTFHGLVQGIAVRNIDERATAAERWQGGDSAPFSLRAKQQANRSLDQFGHRAALTCGLALEFRHEGFVDVDGGFHTEIHAIAMAIWLTAPCGVPAIAWPIAGRLVPVVRRLHHLNLVPITRNSRWRQHRQRFEAAFKALGKSVALEVEEAGR
jgi:hypothetical protein